MPIDSQTTGKRVRNVLKYALAVSHIEFLRHTSLGPSSMTRTYIQAATRPFLTHHSLTHGVVTFLYPEVSSHQETLRALSIVRSPNRPQFLDLCAYRFDRTKCQAQSGQETKNTNRTGAGGMRTLTAHVTRATVRRTKSAGLVTTITQTDATRIGSAATMAISPNEVCML